MLGKKLAIDKPSGTLPPMNARSRGPWLALGLVVVWRLVLLVFTAQPIPANDAFLFDGAVVNWLLHGQYFNPSLAEAFPISGHQVFAAYPPLYQAVLLPWMSVFGTSAGSALWMHFVMFGAAGLLVVTLIGRVLPAGLRYALAVFFLFGITFDDRPDGLAHIFGLAALVLAAPRLDGKARGLAAEAGIAVALLSALYTSLIVGAFYFGAAFLTRAAAWLLARRRCSIGAFAVVVVLFAGITLFIARAHPLLWQGFLENSRQTPVLTAGFRMPAASEIIKLVRTAPVFLLAIGSLPFWLAHRKRLRAVASGDVAWLSLTAGVTVMGGVLLASAMVLVSPNYVSYVLFAQVLVAASLLALGARLDPRGRRGLQVALVGCLALVSVRAVGMTTWGVACASDVSYHRAHEILREELQPLAKSGECVIMSSAFLYGAARLGVRQAIHSDWPYDRRFYAPDADFQALVRLRPPKLILTQFDFHRSWFAAVEQLRQHPDLVTVRVRDTAGVRTPDSIPSFQRVVQHVSWAPVIVTLSWETSVLKPVADQ